MTSTIHYNEQGAKKLRKAMRLRVLRAFSFYSLQTSGILIIVFAALALASNLLALDAFLPKSQNNQLVKANVTTSTLLGTIGSLRCGVSGLVIGTITGAISGAIGYRQKTYSAETEAAQAAIYEHKIALLIQIIKIQIWIIGGAVIIAPLMWLIATRYHTRFFVISEQVLWLYILYLSLAYVSQKVIWIIILLYSTRIVWRLQKLLIYKSIS